MSAWWRHLRGDPVSWLLAGDDPSLLYFFLVDVMGRPASAPAVHQARQAIAHSPVVQAVLAAQHPDGWWGSPDDLTQPPYAGTAWRLILLAELGASGQDARIATASQYVLDKGWQHWGELHVAGLVAWSLIRFGYGDDSYVQAALEGLVAQAMAGGQANPWATLSLLEALAEVPPAQRTLTQQEFIVQAAERFLDQDFEALEPAREALSFPPFGEPDLLLALRVMVSLGRGRDDRLTPLVMRLLSRQDAEARWPLDQGFEDGLVLPLEEEGQPSRWVTLHALRVLRGVYG